MSSKTKFNIIFICKHNIFRSRVAEEYFKKINKNKNIKVSSGGLFKGNCLTSNQIKAARKFGINIINKPKNLSVNLLKKQDLIVIVADDIPKKIFNNKNYVKKLIKWDIPDVLDNDYKKAIKTIKMIIKNTKKLVKYLKNNYNL